MRNFQALILLALLATLSISTTHNYLCTNGCLSCAKNGKCYQCYKRKWQNYKCLENTPPKTQNCRVAINSENGRGDDCLKCNIGTIQNTSQEPWTCVPPPQQIKHCIEAFYFRELLQCYICGNGMYASGDSSKCLPASQVKNPVDHCIWGRVAGENRTKCYRCMKGYMSLNGVRCVEQWTEGCLMTDRSGTRCVECDGANGYFDLMADGKCYKGRGWVDQEVVELVEENFVQAM